MQPVMLYAMHPVMLFLMHLGAASVRDKRCVDKRGGGPRGTVAPTGGRGGSDGNTYMHVYVHVYNTYSRTSRGRMSATWC